MERRRFIPSSLQPGTEIALEPRMLLAASPTGIFGTTGQTTSAASNLPQNLVQRLQRIANLPFFMTTYQPSRSLPASVTAPIQDDLRLIIAQAHNPPQNVLTEFNRTIRSVDGHASLSQNGALSLVNAFNAVLKNSGISDPLRSKFTEDMRALAKLDANSPKPVVLAVNQLVQAVGQPFAAPGEPSLIAADRIPKSNNGTYSHFPTFVGNAPDGVLIRIVDANTDQPLGVSLPTTGGRYSVTLSVPQVDGKHAVQAQTLDNGYESNLSHRYNFQVFTPHTVKAVPKGPMG
jgi:hypothetical protein